ncbi:regulator of G-protein signaling 10-like isoform X2 [Penaeus chinensis]|uniref:regulator of G-protein signaling 10-like isoform X2 n=1 Tax=Penaeus chinensis TaxID=139456 RepID=UPI001FB8514B|nr:regulator of G-protein signaling 10-like isoform X2 [Penaeus chinensis]
MATPAKTDKPKDDKEKDEKPKAPPKPKAPSKPQLEKWVSSINALLSDPEGRKAFRVFLKESEVEDGELTRYIDFFEEVEGYKAEFKRLEEAAKDIFETYLEVGADKEVGTGGKSVDIGDKLEDEGLEGVQLFDEPQKKVKQKLADGQYINFCSHLKEKYKL